MDLRELSQAFREPQLEPSDSCLTILQDHGPTNGGWGPAAIAFPLLGEEPKPFLYTGNADHVIAVASEMCRTLAQTTGKPTRLVRFSQREDLFVVGGSS